MKSITKYLAELATTRRLQLCSFRECRCSIRGFGSSRTNVPRRFGRVHVHDTNTVASFGRCNIREFNSAEEENPVITGSSRAELIGDEM